MSLRRVPPILQGVAQVRNWVVENVPGTDSMLGYDLFLKLGNDLVAGQPLPLSSLVQGIPYAADAVTVQLRRFEEHGLLALSHDADLGLMLRPTERFATLLNHYSLVFESKFIVRDELRGQQLFVDASDAALASLGRVLYDRMHDLGWLYLHNFGGVCFMMASLVRRMAELHGHQARIVSCYVQIEKPVQDGTFSYMLGGRGYAKPGQIEGHAACIIDDRLVVDFGLGNVRKNYRRDFYWGAITDHRRDGATLAQLVLPGGESMAWRDDWQSPEGEQELARYAPLVETLAGQYVERFR